MPVFLNFPESTWVEIQKAANDRAPGVSLTEICENVSLAIVLAQNSDEVGKVDPYKKCDLRRGDVSVVSRSTSISSVKICAEAIVDALDPDQEFVTSKGNEIVSWFEAKIPPSVSTYMGLFKKPHVEFLHECVVSQRVGESLVQLGNQHRCTVRFRILYGTEAEHARTSVSKRKKKPVIRNEDGTVVELTARLNFLH